jgi:hypothetical protein
MTHPQQPPEPGQRPKKRKRLRIAGGIVVVILVAGVAAAVVIDSSIAGRGPTQPGGSPAGPLTPAPAGNAVVTVTYEVSGDAERARNITYSADENLNLSQQNGVDLPWSTEVPFPGNFPAATLSLTAQSGADSPGEITCRILRDDEVISENTASGRYAVLSCPGG